MSDSDFGEKSGVASSKGYDYQKLIATYYLIVYEAREIEYEADGEDITIINEDSNRNSVEYIQAKCKSTGAFTLSDFYQKVFQQFWHAYSNAVSEHSDKGIYCTLVTNVAWDNKLKKFMDGCRLVRERGYTLNNFRSYMKIAERQYNLMKGNKPNEQFWRFLWGLKMLHTFPPEHVKDKIINYMISCGISEPRSKLAQVINYISELGQGRITRRQIENIAGNLTPIKEVSDNPIYSEVQINKILSELKIAKSNYETKEEIPDQERIFRDLTSPVEKASKLIIHRLEEKSRTSDTSPEFQEAREIIISDAEKAREEAQTIASLRSELWIHEKKYTQRISSMQQTAKDFGIGL